ncbi:MAG: tyrosine-type recombinase/integrase [Chloroflexota bacterium]
MDEENALLEFEKYLKRRFPGRRTPVDYVSDLRQFRIFCQKAWREVDMHDIDQFVDRQRLVGLKPATIRRRVASLKTFFDFMAEESNDLSWSNPVRFKRQAGKREKLIPRDLRDDEIEQVWQKISSTRDRAWFALMVRAGLRVGEVVDLKLKDILNKPEGEKPAHIIANGKGRKQRTVLLSADAYAVLSEWLSERGESPLEYIFLNERGQQLSANGIEWLLKGYGREAGFHLTPHQLRHTYARQLTDAGMPITSLSKLMGHSQISTTQIYTLGADPKLAQAYHDSMSRVEQAKVMPEQPGNSKTSELFRPGPIVERAEGAIPDWETWGTHLPKLIREASLDYTKRRWAAWPVSKRRNYTMSLLVELKNLWNWFIEYRPITWIGEIGLKDLWAYQTDQQAKGLAAGTINRRFDYVIGIIRELAEKDQPVDQSVFRIRYIPRPESLPKHLSAEEGHRLENFILRRLNTTDPGLQFENASLLVMLHSGLRVGECVDLHLQDLDLPGKRMIIREGKGQRDRLVYLSESACQAIHLYLQGTQRRPGDFVWLNANGQPYSTDAMRHHIARIGLTVGIEHLHPHRLRHTCATRLLNVGMDIVHIQKLLGHEDLNTTMIYARVYDATVEADYHLFTNKIEKQRVPLSNLPIPADNWPTQIVKVQIAS